MNITFSVDDEPSSGSWIWDQEFPCVPRIGERIHFAASLNSGGTVDLVAKVDSVNYYVDEDEAEYGEFTIMVCAVVERDYMGDVGELAKLDNDAATVKAARTK